MYESVVFTGILNLAIEFSNESIASLALSINMFITCLAVPLAFRLNPTEQKVYTGSSFAINVKILLKKLSNWIKYRGFAFLMLMVRISEYPLQCVK